MTRQPSERRRRFGHLLGVDRLRVVAVYSDGQRITESFDEVTVAVAQQTSAALAAPNSVAGGDVHLVAVEVVAGRWQAIGSTDCEWVDYRSVAAGRVLNGSIEWTTPLPVTRFDPEAGEQLALI